MFGESVGACSGEVRLVCVALVPLDVVEEAEDAEDEDCQAAADD